VRGIKGHDIAELLVVLGSQINQSNTVFVHNHKHGLIQLRPNVPCLIRM